MNEKTTFVRQYSVKYQPQIFIQEGENLSPLNYIGMKNLKNSETCPGLLNNSSGPL